MIGGTVVETLDCKDRVWINCEESCPCGEGNCQGDECSHNKCAICVARTHDALRVAPGDVVWWQSSDAYWTPKQWLNTPTAKKHGYYGIRHDIKLKKIGVSGAKFPGQSLIESAGFTE